MALKSRTGAATTLALLAGVVVTPPTAGWAAGPVARRWQVNAAAGTVLDKRMNLLWQRAVPTAGGSAGDTTGRYSLTDAHQYCDNLQLGGFGDWRLPTLQELRSIVDRKRSAPSIAPVVFPNTPVTGSSNYWTATLYRDTTNNYWAVDFNGGSSSPQSGGGLPHRVRCVRIPTS